MLEKFLSPLSMVATVVVMVAVYAAGYHNARYEYEAELKRIEAESNRALAEAIEIKSEKENAFRETLSDVQSTTSLQTAAIIERFASAVSLGITSDVSDNSDWMSDREGSAGGGSDLPTDTSASSGVQSRDCRCPGADSHKLQRLYEKQLTVARDCDITATRYNELIRLYQSIYDSSFQ